MGMQESAARANVERALELALLAGDLTPGAKGWKRRAEEICDRTLTTPLDHELGHTALDLILTERIETWITMARGEQHRLWRDGLARRLLTPESPPPGAETVLAPMRWLLEQANDGIALTQSHYVARNMVLEAVERFGWWDWEKPPRSEADVPQLGELRGAATALRLVRRQGRSLRTTTKGQTLMTDAVGLWNELATTLGGKDDFDQMVAELIGMRLMAGPAIDDELDHVLVPVIAAQGWRAGAEPVSERHVGHAISFRLFWWRMLRLLDEERPRWENLRRIGHAKTALNAAGEAMVLSYLRKRATSPRRLSG